MSKPIYVEYGPVFDTLDRLERQARALVAETDQLNPEDAHSQYRRGLALGRLTSFAQAKAALTKSRFYSLLQQA